MNSSHPFWQLPLELRLDILERCDTYTLAAFARSYASSDREATSCRGSIELELYRRDLKDGEHVALLFAIESSRNDPVAACGTVAKLRAYGQHSVGGSSAFERELESLISIDRGRYVFQEVPLIMAARIGHPSLFKVLFRAQFLTSTDSIESTKPKTIALAGTKKVLHNRDIRPPQGMTEQIEDMTALGYAFRRSRFDKAGDGPDMLRTMLDCAKLLLRQLAEEGASLQARAMAGSITLAEASESSVNLGVRSQTAYRMGHVLSIDYAPMVPWPQPDSVSILTSLAWYGDPYKLLPGLLRDYRAMVDCSSISWRGNIAPLHGALTSGARREFDVIMELDDINLNIINASRTSTPIIATLSMMQPFGASEDRPMSMVFTIRLEMLRSLLRQGADPNFPARQILPLNAVVNPLYLGIVDHDKDALRFGHLATEALLCAGADPLKMTSLGSCPMLSLLERMHSLAGQTTANAKKTFYALGVTLQQFFEHNPELLAATIPPEGRSALDFAVSRKNNQLTDFLLSLGAS